MAEERRVARQAQQEFPNPAVRIVSTVRPLADHWFSRWHPDAGTAVSSLAGWEKTASIPAEAFVAYELILYGLHGVSPNYDELTLTHEETRGCLFDFLGPREDVEIMLQTVDICPDCRDGLRAAAVPVEPVLELCDIVRRLAHPGVTNDVCAG